MNYPPVNFGDGINEVLSEPSQQRRDVQRTTRERQFVRGPIPMAWLEQAARLPGKTLAVGLLLWFLRGMSKGGVIVLTHSLLARFAIDRKASYRAVTALETAGLIRVMRNQGQCPRIEVIAKPVSKMT